METLIIQPKTKEQLAAMKAVLKALEIEFTMEKESEKPYNSNFVAKMKQGAEDIKAGRTTKIEPADIWKL